MSDAYYLHQENQDRQEFFTRRRVEFLNENRYSNKDLVDRMERISDSVQQDDVNADTSDKY